MGAVVAIEDQVLPEHLQVQREHRRQRPVTSALRGRRLVVELPRHGASERSARGVVKRAPRSWTPAVTALSLVLELSACDRREATGSAAPPPSTAASPAASTTPPLHAPPFAPDAAVESGTAWPDYPTAGLKRLDDKCKDPKAVLLVYPEDDPRPITWLKQALLAHPELRVVRGLPSARMELRIESSNYGGKYFKRAETGASYNKTALVARCADVATCIQVAAMVRAVIRPSGPELICGEPPAVSGQLLPLPPRELAGSDDDLPGAGDGVGQCARLGACARRLAPEAANPIEVCRKRGNAFRSECARRPSCAEVAACRSAGGE